MPRRRGEPHPGVEVDGGVDHGGHQHALPSLAKELPHLDQHVDLGLGVPLRRRHGSRKSRRTTPARNRLVGGRRRLTTAPVASWSRCPSPRRSDDPCPAVASRLPRSRPMICWPAASVSARRRSRSGPNGDCASAPPVTRSTSPIEPARRVAAGAWPCPPTRPRPAEHVAPSAAGACAAGTLSPVRAASCLRAWSARPAPTIRLRRGSVPRAVETRRGCRASTAEGTPCATAAVVPCDAPPACGVGGHRRPEGRDGSGRPLCRPCVAGETHPCPDCSLAVAGGGRAPCQACAARRRGRIRAAERRDEIVSPWAAEMFDGFCEDVLFEASPHGRRGPQGRPSRHLFRGSRPGVPFDLGSRRRAFASLVRGRRAQGGRKRPPPTSVA